MDEIITEDQKETTSSEESDDSNSETKRWVVVPGEEIITGDDYLPGEGARRQGEKILAARYGLAEIAGRVVKVLSVFGAYYPRKNNVIIGKVVDVNFAGWMIDIDAASSAFLPIEESPRFIHRSEMEQFLAVGDVISAKIWGVKSKGIDLSMKGKGLGKLEEGFIFKIIPSRVPRVIGREGSMITLIKEKTNCQITVGQNGWVWVKGEDIDSQIRARKAVEYVAEQVFVSGLTEKMEEWFENN